MLYEVITIEMIIKSLNEPIFEEQDVTILEWWNIYDIDQYLTEKNIINTWDYINYVTNPEKIEALKEFFPFIWNIKTLEWFLYPDTYTISTTWFWINKLVIKQFVITSYSIHYTKLYDRTRKSTTIKLDHRS